MITETDKLLFCIIFWMISLANLTAQNELKGHIMSKEIVPQTIPFANIGIAAHSIGTVSNSLGEFLLKVTDNHIDDSIIFSALGYQSVFYTCRQIKDNNLDTIFLLPQPIMLNEVDITGSSKIKIVEKGKTNPGNSWGRVFNQGSGAQYAKKFDFKGKNVCVQNISTFTTGSKEVKLLRLRIYEFENDLQGENLLNENVFVRIEPRIVIGS